MNELNVPNDDRLQKALSILDTRYMNLDFTPQTWANQLAISVAYLSRLLREQTGKPASVHLRNKRLERAKELLIKAENNIGDIATTCGFNDNNYFSRKFKEYEGLSPTEWQEQYTKKGNF
jgi:two-component system, response regulator YesN